MSKRMEVYKCSACRNIVEGMNTATGELACCGAPMQLETENTTDAAVEKHVPVIEKVDGGYKVTVGEVAHPMADDHWIEWIELIAGKTIYRQFLDPGETPEAFFPVKEEGVTARAYCNLHGLWKK